MAIKHNTNERIYQAVGYVTLQDKRTFKIRISRMYFGSIVHYWQKYPNFKYLKIFEIINYKKGGFHQLGQKIAYVTLKSYSYSPNGIFESQASYNYTQKLKNL